MIKTLFTANPYLWICTLVLGLQTHAASPSSFENSFDKSIIESSVLVNLKTIRQEAQNGSTLSTNRRLSDQYATIDATSSQSIQVEILNSVNPISVDPLFVNSLTSIYDSMPQASLVDGVDYAIDYLAANKNLLSLSDASLILAIKSVYSAFIQSAVNSNLDLTQALKDIPFRSLQNIIPERINLWNQDAPKWSKLLAQALVEAIAESSYPGDKNSLIGTASHSTVTGVLKLINESTVLAKGFYPEIVSIDPSRTETDGKMKFDGTLEKFKNFDPAKTRILEYATKGLADGVFLSSPLDASNISTFSRELGFNAVSGAMEYLNSLGNDHSVFAYEISKSIASGLTLGAVYASTSQAAYVTDNLPAIVAEEMSRAVSEGAITQSLILGNGYSLNRLAETTAFGSSMGAQLASVADKSWDYEDEWASFGRHLLAEATSKGSARGALNAGIGFTASQADVDAGRATSLNEFVKFIENDDTTPDTEFKTTRKELLGIANGSAVGSLLGNTAFAVYYPTLLQPIISYSSQGANSGGILASNLSHVDKPQGVTEQFEIEIARALAHGAAMGAVFQIVTLKDDSMPDKRTFDVETISAVEAVTYGSTFGAITGGIQAGEDAIIIKQAIHQGSKEGASAGVALGLGVSETFADTLTTRSEASINAAVRNANDKAAADANSNMAVKTIQASSRDILQLMRLYNISPRYTNPSGIFSDPNRKAQDKNLFNDPFTVASPI